MKRNIWEYVFVAVVTFVITAVSFSTIVSLDMELKLQSVEIERDYAVVELKEAESRIANLEQSLDEAESIIESKDAILVELGYQPYELNPCYRCGAEVVINVNSEGYYYIDCTMCDVFAGFFGDVYHSEMHWNFEDEG